MFKKAQLKLTLFYSGLFLLVFWTFSAGLFYWMNDSFGKSYINAVKQRQEDQTGQNEGEFNDQKTVIVTIAGQVALDQLKSILIILNGGLLLMIPAFAWFLAGRTLAPIEDSHETQKQFVSDASHELRTPLTIMSGEMESALHKNRTAKEYKSFIASSQEEVNRLTKLVENLLFLARSDQMKQPIPMVEVDLTDTINTVLAQFRSQIDSKKLKIHFDPSEENLTVLGSVSLLQQLFVNLIDNAIKYTPSRGDLWLSIKKRGKEAVISIRDSGKGIPKAEQRKIFERFYRSDVSRFKKGYGLGLSIAYSVVKNHKGRITIESEVGKGATFVVSLPNQ